MQKTAILFLLFLCHSSAQTLTICELLTGLEDLNGKEVRVRGTWLVGHMGEALIATDPCGRRTVRDGWIWQDAIEAFPETNEAKAFGLEYDRLLRHIHPTHPAKIVATLSGRLETRDHFKVDGGRPVAFGYFVALLRYRGVENLEVVAYKPGELEREFEFRRKPEAKRVGGDLAWRKKGKQMLDRRH